MYSINNEIMNMHLTLEKFIYALLAGIFSAIGMGVFLLNSLDVKAHNLGFYKHTLPFFKVFLIAATLGILIAIIFYMMESFLFNQEKNIDLYSDQQPISAESNTPAEMVIPTDDQPQKEENAEPLSIEEAANLQAHHETKNDFEEDISKHSFEDPEVGIQAPAKKLTETPASIFSKQNVDEDAQRKLDDQSELPKLVMPPPAPPAPKPG